MSSIVRCPSSTRFLFGHFSVTVTEGCFFIKQNCSFKNTYVPTNFRPCNREPQASGCIPFSILSVYTLSPFSFAEVLKSYMELDIRVIPMSLILVSSHDTGGGCYAAFFHQDGKLLIGCHDGIRLYSSECNQAGKRLESNPVTSITSVDEQNSYIFIMHQRDERKVGQISPEFESWKKIFDFDFRGTNAVYVTASTKFVVTCAVKSLLVYNLSTKAKVTKRLGFQPWVLLFDSEENLLLTSSTTLYKYSMDEQGELSPMWTCEEIVGPGGIAFTKYGDIVVQNIENPEIFIISPQCLFNLN